MGSTSTNLKQLTRLHGLFDLENTLLPARRLRRPHSDPDHPIHRPAPVRPFARLDHAGVTESHHGIIIVLNMLIKLELAVLIQILIELKFFL